MASAAFDQSDSESDTLTGLASAASARRRLERWRCIGPGGAPATPGWQAMLIGLRRFQSINHAYGEAAGDLALAEIGRRIRDFASDELDGEWVAARFGGSEFLLVARAPCSRERWSWLAEALADAIAAPLVDHGSALRLAPRVALLRAGADEPVETALDAVSQALGEAQKQPGRRLLWADGARTPRGRGAAAMEADLLGALERNEIRVLFQPQFAIADGRVTGAEALARWEHPTLGRLGAATLFAAAERAEQTVQLSQHIARAALTAAARWPAARGLRLSLNLTAADLAAGSFAATLREAIAKARFDHSRLTLEVTEQALLVDLDGAARALAALAGEGMRVALDDFGTGFSNFRYLKALPLDYLKLDHSLTDDIVTAPRDRAILRAIVAMARALELDVIAEGVESEAQLAVLGEEGCASWQGFLRAGPMSADEFVTFARTSVGTV